jgi:hypothetical protein
MQRYKKIKLTQGKWALVDVEDYPLISGLKWYFDKNTKDKTGYAFRNAPTINGKRGKRIRMHTFLMGANVDHKNGNGLDNRRSNLRISTKYQQAFNKGVHSHKKSLGCKGVSIVKDKKGVPKYWIDRITFEKTRIYLGTFKTHVAASRAYIKKAKELHGEFAKWK